MLNPESHVGPEMLSKLKQNWISNATRGDVIQTKGQADRGLRILECLPYNNPKISLMCGGRWSVSCFMIMCDKFTGTVTEMRLTSASYEAPALLTAHC